MAANAVECDFPDEVLFGRWRDHDRHARDQIFVALWDTLIQIGFHYCNAAFRFYRERDALSEDVARHAFLDVWRGVNQLVLSGEFEWQGCSRFHAYCHLAYRNALHKGINQQHKRARTEIGFEQDPDTLPGLGDDLGRRRLESQHGLIARVHHFSYTAQRLHDRGQDASSEVANLIVLYLKCEVARHTKTFRGPDNADLPVDTIAAQRIEDLLADVPEDSQLQVGSDATSQRFRNFLMQQLCDFELSDETRTKYCDVLQIQFTIHQDDGRRRRITQTELMQAHKASRRAAPEDPLTDEAYIALTTFLSNRALVDQRWARFKAESKAFQNDD